MGGQPSTCNHTQERGEEVGALVARNAELEAIRDATRVADEIEEVEDILQTCVMRLVLPDLRE